MTTTATPAPSTSSTSTSSSPTTASTAAGAPGVPEPARQHTEAGAIAFARYYVDLINESGMHPKLGMLEPLAEPGCKTCANYAANVKYLKSHEWTTNRTAATVRKSYRLSGEPGMIIELVVRQNEIDYIDREGRSQQHFDSADGGLVFDLSWTTGGWRVKTITGDKAVR